jgi:hypothetical protein
MLIILRAKKGKKKEYNYPLCIKNDNKDESPFHCDPTKEQHYKDTKIYCPVHGHRAGTKWTRWTEWTQLPKMSA